MSNTFQGNVLTMFGMHTLKYWQTYNQPKYIWLTAYRPVLAWLPQKIRLRI